MGFGDLKAQVHTVGFEVCFAETNANPVLPRHCWQGRVVCDKLEPPPKASISVFLLQVAWL